MQSKKLPFVIRYILNRYKTQQMCDKTVLENGGATESVPYQNKMQELCDKAVHTCFNVFHSLPI